MNRPNSHILRKRVDHGHDFDGEHRTQYHEPEKNKEEIDPCDVCSKCECEVGTSSDAATVCLITFRSRTKPKLSTRVGRCIAHLDEQHTRVDENKAQVNECHQYSVIRPSVRRCSETQSALCSHLSI
eukprot:7248603-Prymnesium_polylepis.1